MKFRVQSDRRTGSHPLLGTKWGQVPWPSSLKPLNKKTPLAQFVALLKIRIILKNEHNRSTLEEVIAKSRYGTKWPKKRGDLSSELKLDI